MNTRNMPEEEELDQMFRQAADLYQPEFDPAAWQAMETKLDAPTKPKDFLFNGRREALILLLIALTGIFMFLKQDNRKTETAATNKASTVTKSEKRKF